MGGTGILFIIGGVYCVHLRSFTEAYFLNLCLSIFTYLMVLCSYQWLSKI